MSIPPLVLVVVSPVVTAPIAPAPANVTVIGWFIGKFEPVTNSGRAVFHETTPDVGVMVIEDTVDVKVAVAVLADESVIEMRCDVGRKAGTMNVATIAPVAENATNDGVTVRPSIEKPPNVADFAKPEPMIVTVVPTAALDGLTTLIVGAPVFVNAAEPVIPVAVTEWTPAPDSGTLNEPAGDGGVGHVFPTH